MKVLSLLSIFFIMFVVSCDSDDDVSNTITYSSITDAKSLLIQNDQENPSASGMTKITHANALTNVKFENSAGDNVTDLYKPVAIYQLSSGFVLLQFLNSNENYVTYLVDTNNGISYYLPGRNPGWCNDDGCPPLDEPWFVQVDTSDNFYFPASGGFCIGNIVGETITYFEDHSAAPCLYAVNDFGVVGYADKLRFPSGAYVYSQQVPVNAYTNNPGSSLILGLDNEFLYVNSNNLIKMTVNADNTVAEETIATGVMDCILENYSLEERIVILGLNSDLYVYDLNASETLKKYYLTDLINYYAHSIRKKIAANNSMYIIAKNSINQSILYRLNFTIDNITSEEITTPNLYDIYDLEVNDFGEVTFYALRLSDGANIIGNIDSSNNITILDEISSTITYLVSLQ